MRKRYVVISVLCVAVCLFMTYNVPRKLDSSIRWQRDPGPW